LKERIVSPIIRVAQESDAERMLNIYAPIVRETAISFELAPPTVDEFRQRIRSVLDSHNWLVMEDEHAILGYAYAGKFRPREAYQWAAEVTVYVDSPHQKRGIAQALYTSLFAGLRLQGFCNVIAAIALPNLPSVRLHEKLDFKPMGILHSVGYKMGRWHDVGWWQLQLQDNQPNPDPPQPISALENSAAWAQAQAAGLFLLKT
jgi:L-amino acid N-acyltransferase YncA